MKDIYIVWNKDNEIGIPIIDEQHRVAVGTINSLFYFMQMKRGVAALRPTLSVLEQYTKIHFETEEELMKLHGFRDLDAHLLLHRDLQSQTHEVLHEALANSDATIVLNFLKDWWLDHINKQDRKFAEHLRHTGAL